MKNTHKFFRITKNLIILMRNYLFSISIFQIMIHIFGENPSDIPHIMHNQQDFDPNLVSLLAENTGDGIGIQSNLLSTIIYDIYIIFNNYCTNLTLIALFIIFIYFLLVNTLYFGIVY